MKSSQTPTEKARDLSLAKCIQQHLATLAKRGWYCSILRDLQVDIVNMLSIISVIDIRDKRIKFQSCKKPDQP